MRLTVVALLLALAFTAYATLTDFVDVDYEALPLDAECYITLESTIYSAVSTILDRHFTPTALPTTFKVDCFDPAVAYVEDIIGAKKAALTAMEAIPGVKSVVPAQATLRPMEDTDRERVADGDCPAVSQVADETGDQWYLLNDGEISGCVEGVDINVDPLYGE
ncbi:hypothetical protein KIPB_012145, partial [Kipferlia bialata]|eukprot:g12145.t1